MFQPTISIEFIFLCSIQIVTSAFSLLVLFHGLRRYRNTDKSEEFLRKSVKYFIFIMITILISGAWGLFVNIYFVATSNGFVAGYLYGGIITCILVNAFCAWQFLNYLIHPDRRVTKYPVGIAVTIGIVMIWLYPSTMVSPLFSPIVKNMLTYFYPVVIFIFVYAILSFEFFKHARSSEKKQRYRYMCLGFSALLSLLMFLGFFLGLIFAWFIILNSTILYYLGYSFPKSFQRALKIEE